MGKISNAIKHEDETSTLEGKWIKIPTKYYADGGIEYTLVQIKD